MVMRHFNKPAEVTILLEEYNYLKSLETDEAIIDPIELKNLKEDSSILHALSFIMDTQKDKDVIVRWNNVLSGYGKEIILPAKSAFSSSKFTIKTI